MVLVDFGRPLTSHSKDSFLRYTGIFPFIQLFGLFTVFHIRSAIYFSNIGMTKLSKNKFLKK